MREECGPVATIIFGTSGTRSKTFAPMMKNCDLPVDAPDTLPMLVADRAAMTSSMMIDDMVVSVKEIINSFILHGHRFIDKGLFHLPGRKLAEQY